jgi:pimeloyl-ACP methyl ester carboxylesterase
VNASTVAVRGGLFQIEVFSGGKGQPILYLHDEYLPRSARSWQDDLARSAWVITPSHPGCGASTGLERLDDVHDLVIYYLDFLDALDLASVDLIGESFGGMIAAELASLAPDRVRKLVLVGALGLWLDETPLPDPFAMPAADLHALAWADPASEAAQPFAPDIGSEDEQRPATLDRMRSLSVAAKFLWPIPDKGLRKRIHRLKAPTLLLWGGEDRLVPPEYGRGFQELIPGSDLVLMQGAGHFPLIERVEETTGVLKGFFEG